MNLYVNRTNLGFEDCDDVEATQTLQLNDEDLKENGPATQLKYVKYQRVKSLTIFIEENQGGDVTCLGGLKLFGRVSCIPLKVYPLFFATLSNTFCLASRTAAGGQHEYGRFQETTRTLDKL